MRTKPFSVSGQVAQPRPEASANHWLAASWYRCTGSIRASSTLTSARSIRTQPLLIFSVQQSLHKLCRERFCRLAARQQRDAIAELSRTKRLGARHGCLRSFLIGTLHRNQPDAVAPGLSCCFWLRFLDGDTDARVRRIGQIVQLPLDVRQRAFENLGFHDSFLCIDDRPGLLRCECLHYTIDDNW